MAEMKVAIDGAASTSAPIVVRDTAGSTVNIALPGPNLGAGLVTTSGSLVSVTNLSAVTTGTGATVDFGSGKARMTAVFITSAGVSAGACAIDVSQDGTNWLLGTPVTTNTASTVFHADQTGAWRYARTRVTTDIVGGTVTTTLMSS